MRAFTVPDINPALRMGGPTVATKLAGWRLVARDERELVRLILINQNTMRLAGLIPEWSSFMDTSYAREMQGYLEPGMVAKMKAWWELCQAAHHRDPRQAHARLMYCWEFLARVCAHERHGAAPSVPEVPKCLTEDQAGELRDVVRRLKAELLRA